ncbi:thioredoxin family protein [Geothrix sp. PMB-07]|uniref:thioredoxin family protein n=1 Tax=Geothrix sp. PMB-07 TaxID=3068640 RepID=UPI0027419C7E|nr:thioredoxin family protein [Geothrix sp. PMB-07]WLT31830.1 thioredoxin family protein [Geothrix sp. PMB-07]
MKSLLATAAIILSTLGTAHAAEWGTDVPKAIAKAKAENKLVVLDFTGSDWCGWCIKLKKEVFDTPEFEAYAAKNLVLVEVDFPRKKEMSAQQKATNQQLAAKYGIKGYPTIFVLEGSGMPVGKLGYMEGGPKPFIAELAKLKK